MRDELFNLCQAGQQQRLLEGLIEQHHTLVRSVCRRYLRDPHDVEDAVQETFAKLLRHRGQVQGSIASWLMSVAYSTSIDLIRSAIGERNRRHGLSKIRSETADDSITHEAIRRRLHEALAAIEPAARELIVERFFRQTSLRVLAGQKRVSVPTMSRRVASAIRQLAETLLDMGIDADEVTVAQHFGDSALLPGAESIDRAGLRFAPDWRAEELTPGGIARPTVCIDGWSRPLRVGVMVSYASTITIGTHGLYGGVWEQVRSTIFFTHPGLQLVGIIEPGTSHRAVVERTMRDFQLTGGLVEADNIDDLQTLDVILLGNCFATPQRVPWSMIQAVKSGVGLLNEYWTSIASHDNVDDPNLIEVMLGASPYHGYHTPGGCGGDRPAVMIREHPLLPGLKAGTRIIVGGCGPAYHVLPSATLVMAQEQRIAPQRHGMSHLGELPLPSFVVGELGRGRVVVSHIHPHERVLKHLAITPTEYFLNLLRWLAEPRQEVKDQRPIVAIGR